MTFDVPVTISYVILYSVLLIFTLLAAASADLFSCLPNYLRNILVLVPSEKSGDDKNAIRTADFFLSARHSARYFTIAMSYFAGGMGAWVVYGTTEMGANPQLSWLGVLGYSGASAFPALIVCMIGPRIRRLTEENPGEKAFSCTDFTKMRYGRVMQVATICISIFYMFIYLVAELTSISNVYALLVGKDSFSNSSLSYTISIAVSIGVITIFYTGLAGLPGSIITDKIQGVLMAALVLLLLFSFTVPENQVTKEQFSKSSNWTADGAIAAVTLFIAIASAEMFNQGTWQRVWAAKTVTDLRIGFCLGSFFVFLLMMIFGVLGMIAYSKDPDSYDTFQKYAYLSFFDFIAPLAQGWHILVLFLTAGLCASTVDTLQNALASFLSADLLRVGCSPKWIARMLVLLINIPAIYLSVKRYDVISLFLVADLVCATSVFPVFLGLITSDQNAFLPAPTELGAFLGCIAGIVTVLVNGSFLGQGTLNYFWLQNGSICALCGYKTMTTFIIVPVISAFFTLLCSKLDIMFRGNRARKPIFHFEFDDNTVVDEERGKAQDVEKSDMKKEVNAATATTDDKFVPNPIDA